MLPQLASTPGTDATLEQKVSERTRELTETVRRLSKEIAELRSASEESEARARSQERQALLARLSAGLTHELRNPLQGIMGYLELLRMRTGKTEGLSPLLDRIGQGLEDLNHLAGQLRDLSGREAESPATVTPLEPILERVSSLFGPLAAKANAQFRNAVATGLPPVRANSERLADALLNLLRHALEVSGPGGTVTLGARIHPTAPGMIEVWVSDTGTGIPAELRAQAFEPFFSTRASGRGAGLGLTIAKRIVEACGGAAAVVERGEPGTTLSVSLQIGKVGQTEPGASGVIVE